ncbi:hypothetical protein JNW91_16800 [Micromonospora sp. STR1_7]|uniref:Uncharacterized protein n=1 Tax=Micromonospora parastrephiae TaxID=2806101 RepID=A0ABS1XVV4_9ACTN|nr:hypothetical protein [Micromonospora parastrephiae]MBM0233368.1 hypothetical protein [Micromonospora parastrephiae]
MNLDRDSVTSFAPVDPDLYEVAFTGEDESWTLPVIGFAVVVTYAAQEDHDLSETGVCPVLIGEDGYAVTLRDLLSELSHRPQATLRRKAAP